MQYNQQHVQALEMIGEFLQPDNPDKAFILKGSASTSKATLMNTVADMLPDNFKQVVIAAPTNKAAKVLSKKRRVCKKLQIPVVSYSFSDGQNRTSSENALILSFFLSLAFFQY